MTTPAVVVDPADRVAISPADRFTIIGKTGSGKTVFTSVLALTVVPDDLIAQQWRVWLLDTKGDPKDIARLRRLGFVEGNPVDGHARQRNRFSTKPEPGRLYFRLRERPGLSIVDQAAHLFTLAMARRRVLVVIDEYTQVIVGPRTGGRALDEIEVRGRGLGVGLVGLTQEPTYIPRKLISQATHLFLFDLSYPVDIDYMRKFIPDYGRPPRHERHAFWHLWLDGDAIPRYYPSLRAWRSRVGEESTNGSSHGTHRPTGR